MGAQARSSDYCAWLMATGAEAGHDNGGSGGGGGGGDDGMKINGFPPPPFYKSVGQLKGLQKPKSHR